MTTDRLRGGVLYAVAFVLVVVGAVWWFRAAPRSALDPELARWRATAERLLPEPADAEASATIELYAETAREVDAQVDVGAHHVSVICVGGANSRVRVSLGDADDTGRGLDCSGMQTPFSFDVSVAGGVRLTLNVGSSPVIFRYTVARVA